MKFRTLFFSLPVIFLLNAVNVNAQAVNLQDSLALVDLYNSTNGPLWKSSAGWLTVNPLSTWGGVGVSGGRVVYLNLINNKLSGTLPSSIGNLNQLTIFNLSQNQITGNIPATLVNLTKVTNFRLDYNQLSGRLPTGLVNLPKNSFFTIHHNNFNFSGIDYLLKNMLPSSVFFIRCSPQYDIPLINNGGTLSIVAGGTLSKNTYKWYNDTTLIATKTGDSAYTISQPGNYSVQVSNSDISAPHYGSQDNLLLYSNIAANQNDSLTMVSFYNSTNGASWINTTNWMTAAPLNAWYGLTVRFGRVIKVELPSNQLAGSLPTSFSQLVSLNSINLQSNQLSGNLPELDSLSQLSIIALTYNSFSGTLPDSFLCKAPVTAIDFNYNQFSGPLPSAIGNPLYTNTIILKNNNFTGNIPAYFSKLPLLRDLELGYNQISGTIPDSIGLLPSLAYVDFGNNKLTGSIPSSLCKLPLTFIRLNNNRFTGSVPDSFALMPVLRTLYLNDNNLSGPLSSGFGTSILNIFNVQNNKFNFSGMETLPFSIYSLIYNPQANIPLVKTGSAFSVMAGGTLANDTFRLYKDGVLKALQIGDSLFVSNTSGRYNIVTTNNVAKQLVLLSDTIPLLGISLANNNITVTQTVSGVNSIDVENASLSQLLLTIAPAQGANALSGNVDCKVTIDPVVTSYNNQPYVQRHYDIEPAANAANALATVTLYFTQQDFDNFNNTPGHGLDLPANAGDAAGIANLRVYQYHGFSATSLPGTYPGPAIEINPADENIVWNILGNYWEVKFDVNGFSGFFVSSQANALLPVKLISFSGAVQNSAALLQWVTSSEINAAAFELQRSVDGNTFNGIAKIDAIGNSNINNSYRQTDVLGTAQVYYYRLKIIDRDGAFVYSKVIVLANPGSKINFTIYPNPAKDNVVLQFPPVIKNAKIKILDVKGSVLRVIFLQPGDSQYTINVKQLPKGAYKIIVGDGKNISSKTLLVE